MSIKNLNKSFTDFILRYSHDGVERQQLIAYLIAVGMIIVGMSIHLLGVIGANPAPLRLLSITAIVMTIISFVFFLFENTSIRRSFLQLAVVIMVVQTAKIIYIAMELPASAYPLILMNSMITLMSMILLAFSFLPVPSIITGIINIITMILVAIGYNIPAVRQFSILIILFSFFIGLMADMMARSVAHLQNENKGLQNDEKRLLNILRLNRNEIKAYVEMCRKDEPDDDDTDRLFALLSDKTQRNVIKAVERKKALDAGRERALDKVIPDLTPMELQVAQLILRDYKLGKISKTTGKSEANISVVRSRLRKKLGLKPEDDLRQALMKVVGL